MSGSQRASNSGRTTWLAFALAAGASGMLALSFPPLGYLLLLGLVGGILVSRPRLNALSGLLAGWGASWIFVLVTAAVRCAEANAQPGRECSGPDLGPWLIVRGGALLIGIVLGFAGMSSRD